MSSLLKDVNPHIRDRNIKFYEKGHIYYVKRERGYKSVTTLVHNLFEKFNADKIIDRMMNSENWPNSKYFGIDIHPYKLKEEKKMCNRLASVYATQDEAIRSFDGSNKVEILPMYLQNIIGSNDVYDYVHTNPNGSKKISEYIKLQLWPND